MSTINAWELKTDNLVNELKNGKRLDARKVDEVRKISIQKNFSLNADGCARVKFGQTDVIAGVKFAVMPPYPDSPNEGTISVGAELLALASPDFEAGPPREDSIELSRVVDRGIRESKAIDFESLSIREKELAWTAFVDLYILNDDGNLFDACALAALSSLLEARIPKLEDDKIVKGEYAGKLKLQKKPVLSTFAKIANINVLDPVLLEEKAMSSRFSVSTTEDDRICAFQKGFGGSYNFSEVDQMIDIAFANAKHLRSLL